MADYVYLPHIDLLLAAMHIQRERLEGKSKVAVDARLLRALIQAVVKQQPFSDTFYSTTYSDVAAAHKDGRISDLREHFLNTGFFEGRLGALPEVDETYYSTAYPDVAGALKSRKVASASEHYMLSGFIEGRAPSAAVKTEVDGWMALLNEYPERS